MLSDHRNAMGGGGGGGGCRVGSEDRGGGGDEDAMPVHDWRRQRERSSICTRREKEAAWNGGVLEHHRRCRYTPTATIDASSSLDCVLMEDTEQVYLRHLLASSVKWNDCHTEGQVSKVSGWCIPVHSRCVMSGVCYSVSLIFVFLFVLFIDLFYSTQSFSVLSARRGAACLGI